MKIRFEWVPVVLAVCLASNVAWSYPFGCASDYGGVCESVQTGGHICPKCGRHVVPDGRGMFKMVPASQCPNPACRSSGSGSSGSSSSSGSSYDWEAAKRAEDARKRAEDERQKKEAEALRKQRIKNAAKAREKWNATDAQTLASMEAMFSSSSSKKGIPQLQCDCDHGWRKCKWCDGTGTRDCTRYGCRDGKLVCGCVRPGVGPKADCPDCKGSGEIECPICNGAGTVPCNWCNSKGKVCCWACNLGFRDPTQIETMPDPLADIREERLCELLGTDESELTDQQKAQRSRLLLSLEPPAPSVGMVFANQSVLDRDLELTDELLRKYGGRMPDDPIKQDAFQKELELLLKNDPERNFLVGQQINRMLIDSAEEGSAFRELVDAAGGDSAVLVPSFDAAPKLFEKNSPYDQLGGPIFSSAAPVSINGMKMRTFKPVDEMSPEEKQQELDKVVQDIERVKVSCRYLQMTGENRAKMYDDLLGRSEAAEKESIKNAVDSIVDLATSKTLDKFKDKIKNSGNEEAIEGLRLYEMLGDSLKEFDDEKKKRNFRKTVENAVVNGRSVQDVISDPKTLEELQEVLKIAVKHPGLEKVVSAAESIQKSSLLIADELLALGELNDLAESDDELLQSQRILEQDMKQLVARKKQLVTDLSQPPSTQEMETRFQHLEQTAAHAEQKLIELEQKVKENQRIYNALREAGCDPNDSRMEKLQINSQNLSRRAELYQRAIALVRQEWNRELKSPGAARVALQVNREFRKQQSEQLAADLAVACDKVKAQEQYSAENSGVECEILDFDDPTRRDVARKVLLLEKRKKTSSLQER